MIGPPHIALTKREYRADFAQFYPVSDLLNQQCYSKKMLLILNKKYL